MSDSPRTLLQKIILCVLAVMVILFGILTAVNRSKPGVQFEGTLLTVSQEGDTTVYSGKVHGDAVTIRAYPDGEGTAVEFTRSGAATIRCQLDRPQGTMTTEYGYVIPRVRIIRDGKTIFEGGLDENGNLFDQDGSYDHGFYARAVTSDPWNGFEFTKHDILRFAGEPVLSRRGSWGMYGIGVVFSVIASLFTAFPYFFFYLEHFMSVENPEPTDFAIFGQRVGMVALTVVAFIIYMNGLNLIE